MTIPISDNQNVIVGGYETNILLSSTVEESKALHAIAEMSVWDLIDKNQVSFVNSSFGKVEDTKKSMLSNLDVIRQVIVWLFIPRTY